MKKYLPGHRPSPDQLKSVPRNALFLPIRALGATLSRQMNEITNALDAGDDAMALRLMKVRCHIPEKSNDPVLEHNIQ